MSRRMLALQRVVVHATNRPVESTDMTKARRMVLRMEQTFPVARGVSVTRSELAGVQVRRFSSSITRDCILHLHGGGYFSGSSNMARRYSRFAAGNGPDIISVDYRLAPEHPYPAGLDDALAVSAALPYDRVIVMGDSAGGGLALALAQHMRDAGRAMAGLILFFPWLDLTHTSESWALNAGRDMLTHDGLSAGARDYAGAFPLDDPGVSPLFGSMDGLPPTYITVGSRDSLSDDSENVTQRMRAAGVEVTLNVVRDAFHGFVVLPVPEARTALTATKAFVEGCLA